MWHVTPRVARVWVAKTCGKHHQSSAGQFAMGALTRSRHWCSTLRKQDSLQQSCVAVHFRLLRSAGALWRAFKYYPDL